MHEKLQTHGKAKKVDMGDRRRGKGKQKKKNTDRPTGKRLKKNYTEYRTRNNLDHVEIPRQAKINVKVD